MPFGIASFIWSRFLGFLAFFASNCIYSKIYQGEVLGFLAFLHLLCLCVNITAVAAIP